MQCRRTSILSSILALSVVSTTVAAAQSVGTIKGHVTGPTGDPLAGASVLATGTERGAIVRGDGAYQFTLPAGRYELRARQIGFTLRVDSVTVTAG